MYIRLLDNSSMHKKNTHCTPTNTMPRTSCTTQHYFYISNPKIHTVSLVNWIWKILNSSGIWDCVPGKQMVQSYFLVSKFSQVLSLLQRETKATSTCGRSELCQTPHRKSSFPWQVCNILQHKNIDHCRILIYYSIFSPIFSVYSCEKHRRFKCFFCTVISPWFSIFNKVYCK